VSASVLGLHRIENTQPKHQHPASHSHHSTVIGPYVIAHSPPSLRQLGSRLVGKTPRPDAQRRGPPSVPTSNPNPFDFDRPADRRWWRRSPLPTSPVPRSGAPQSPRGQPPTSAQGLNPAAAAALRPAGHERSS
jgi:hypothetical protein